MTDGDQVVTAAAGATAPSVLIVNDRESQQVAISAMLAPLHLDLPGSERTELDAVGRSVGMLAG